MKLIDKKISEHLERLKKKIQEKMDSKGLNASGDASNSLEVEGNKLSGNDYIVFLDQGRRPGKMPPAQNLIEWIRNKLGLSGKEAERALWPIRKKIADDGSQIYQDKSKGIELEEMVEETLAELDKDLPDVMIKEADLFLYKGNFQNKVTLQ